MFHVKHRSGEFGVCQNVSRETFLCFYLWWVTNLFFADRGLILLVYYRLPVLRSGFGVALLPRKTPKT